MSKQARKDALKLLANEMHNLYVNENIDYETLDYLLILIDDVLVNN